MTQPKKPGTTRKYLTNSVWLMSRSVVSAVAALVVLTVVAQMLGPEQFGAYTYVFALANLFAVLGHLGLDSLVIRELVARKDEHPLVLGTAFAMRFAGHALGAILCLAYGLLFPGHSTIEIWLFVAASLFILLTPLPILFLQRFNSRVEARFAVIPRIVGNVVGSGFKVVAVMMGAGVVVVGFAQTAIPALVLMIALPLFLYRGGPVPWRWRVSWAEIRVLLGESWKVFLGTLLSMIYLKIDTVMLRWWRGVEEVGIYGVAARMSEVFYLVPLAVIMTLFPRLIQLHKTKREIFDARFQGLLRFLAVLAFLSVLVVLLAGPWAIELIFGPAYVDAGPIVMVHILSVPFIFMNQAFYRWLLIEKYTGFMIVANGLGATANVVLNALLIPDYGMMGAAVATLISYSAAAYLVLAVHPRTRPVFVMMTRALIMPWMLVKDIKAWRSGTGLK